MDTPKLNESLSSPPTAPPAPLDQCRCNVSDRGMLDEIRLKKEGWLIPLVWMTRSIRWSHRAAMCFPSRLPPRPISFSHIGDTGMARDKGVIITASVRQARVVWTGCMGRLDPLAGCRPKLPVCIHTLSCPDTAEEKK